MKSFPRAVLLTGLLAGTMDLIYAYISQFIKTGKFASHMLHYIAGGGLGLETSMKGGFWVGVLGLFFHFFIALAFTFLFFVIYPVLKLQKLNRYAVWILIGLLYSPVVDMIMFFIVLPLSKLPGGKPLNFPAVLIQWVFFAIAFSIPIAICADIYYRKRMRSL